MAKSKPEEWLEIEWYNGGKPERALIRRRDIRNLQPVDNGMAAATIMGFFRNRVGASDSAVLIIKPTYAELKVLVTGQEPSNAQQAEDRTQQT